MRSLLLLWPKPPAIQQPFALNIKRDRLGGKVTSSYNGSTLISTKHAGQKHPLGHREKVQRVSGHLYTVGCRERENQTAHERRQCVIYVSSERSGNWE